MSKYIVRHCLGCKGWPRDANAHLKLPSCHLRHSYTTGCCSGSVFGVGLTSLPAECTAASVATSRSSAWFRNITYTFCGRFDELRHRSKIKSTYLHMYHLQYRLRVQTGIPVLPKCDFLDCLLCEERENTNGIVRLRK